jgi:hypothetical protein
MERSWSRERGGLRLIYYWHAEREIILMLFLYRKSEQKDLTADQKTSSGEGSATGAQMNPKDFDELIESVREGGRILRGEAKTESRNRRSNRKTCRQFERSSTNRKMSLHS